MFLTFLSKAKKPRTIVTIVGASRQESNLRNGRSTNGKSFGGGRPRTIGLAIAGSGIKIHCPPPLGTGTVRSKWEIYRSSIQEAKGVSLE